MKRTKDILTKLNLILFLGSFSLFTFNSFGNTRALQSPDHVPQHFTSKQDAGTDGSSQQLSEKNETENESNFELQALTLPFSISYFLVEISLQPITIISAAPFAEETAHSIYASVCNFRI